MLVQGSTPANRSAALVGRRGEVGRLHDIVQALGDGGPPIVEVVGDPGIGKTRLLTELADLASRAGRLTLWGRAAEFERHAPFAMVTEALEDHLAATPDEQLAGLRAHELRLLRGLFPSLPGRADDAERGEIEAERYRLHRAMRALLEALAPPTGLVLILDDLHWADEGSAELVEHLLRHPPRGRVLLAVAHRPRQTPARLRYAFTRAVQHGIAEVMEVGPLSASDADALLPGGMADARRRELYSASGGNPFYLQALSRPSQQTSPGAVRAEGSAALGLDEAIPAPVWTALAAELSALTPAQTLVAQAVAVAGDGAEADLVAQTAGVGVDEVLATLDELAHRDLVRPIGASARFQFRHPLVRHATYSTAGAGWRVSAHTRAAAALAGRGASAAEKAHHVERSARPGDMHAVALLSEAATATLPTTPATAAHWLAAALRLLPDDGGSTPKRLELLGLHAKALGITGRLRESRAALHELLRLLPADAAEQRTQIVAFSALMERLLGRHVEARAMLQAELGRLPDPDSPAALALKISLAIGHVMRTDPAGRDWASEALATARRNADRAKVAGALVLCVLTSHLTEGTDSRADGWLDEAAVIADGLADGELAESMEILGWLGVAELCQERTEQALRHLSRALRVSRATGQSHFVSYLHGSLGVTYALLGHLTEAAECFDDELDAALLTGSASLRSTALEHQCWKHIWLGDTNEALRVGKEAVACASDGEYLMSHTAAAMLAGAHYNVGDAVTCRDLLVEAGGGPSMPDMEPVGRPSWFELLAAAEAALGNIEEATAWADRAEAAAAGFPRRTGFAHLARVHAMLGADPATAAQHALSAARDFDRAGDRVSAGRAHHYAGMALGALGDTDGAREQFSHARAILEACGARFYLEQTVREERRMNARQPRRTRSAETAAGPQNPALTARERQVAELVVEGLTNRQIAEALFLSPKTVDVHLGRVYAKLGVSRRAAVGARLTQLESVVEGLTAG